MNRASEVQASKFSSRLASLQGVFKHCSRRGKEADFGAKNTPASLPGLVTPLLTILELTVRQLDRWGRENKA